MQTNALPFYDDSVNLTGCCARFNPDGWDGAHLHFEQKPFVRATTRSLAHIPLDMGRVFTRVQNHIATADAQDPHQVLVLSREMSSFHAEHLFAVTTPVAGEDLSIMSGEFTTRVFEGPYSQVRHWHQTLKEDAEAHHAPAKAIWFFYTTCPACAKAYGQNYVVGVTQR